MLKYQSSVIKCKLINDKNCTWNCCMIQNGSQRYVVTTIAMILLSLPCKNLKNTFSKNLRDLSSLLLDVTVWIQSSNNKISAEFTTAWQSKRFNQIIKKVRFSSEMLSNDNGKNSNEAMACCDLHNNDELLSWFGVFSVENFNLSHWTLPNSFVNLYQGMTVWTNSFPFGDSNYEAFYNCISKGILCNIIDDVFLLIDACCLPGSQGAWVYGKNFKPLGVVIWPLELKTGQLAGMSIVCSWKEVFSSFMIQSTPLRLTLVNKIALEKSKIDASSKEIEVVSLRHSNGWGSGVVVMLDELSKKIYIATCRHVVEPANNQVLCANFFCGTRMHRTTYAKVVYSSMKKSWLDFALLEVNCDCTLFSDVLQKMQNFCIKSDQIYILNYARNYQRGKSIISKGYCLFDSTAITPTITKGILSSMVFAKNNALVPKNSPILLHSNCTVLDGISGGGIFSAHDWVFYGLVVNNIKEHFDDQKCILYQNINFVLPAAVFMPTVLSYRTNKSDFSVLNRMSFDVGFQKAWLVPTHSFCVSKL